MKTLHLTNNENELMCCDLSWNRPGETFWGHVVKLSINFEEIPSCVVGYFEEQRNKI